MIWIFLDHIDVELYQNVDARAFSPSMFCSSKRLHPMIEVFFSGGESQRKKLQALFGPSIQLKHSTASWKFPNEEISIFDPTKMDLFPKQ